MTVTNVSTRSFCRSPRAARPHDARDLAECGHTRHGGGDRQDRRRRGAEGSPSRSFPSTRPGCPHPILPRSAPRRWSSAPSSASGSDHLRLHPHPRPIAGCASRAISSRERAWLSISTIPVVRRSPTGILVDVRSKSRELRHDRRALRALRTNLQFINVDHPPRTIVDRVSSRRGGKSTIGAISRTPSL